jgi:hypothetical protein
MFDDELCTCGHSKGYHKAHILDKHGAGCEKCDCIEYCWGKFVVYGKYKTSKLLEEAEKEK